jgi:LuxR family transcriptional regulator, maltose regulon positive regulatory protein
MPRVSQHALTWSRADNSYELTARGRAERRFGPGDEGAWQGWLATATAFAFRGACGSLNVYLEARPRGGRYWYAYHTARGRTIKRYLGRTASVSFACLEAAARALADGPPPACPTPVPGPCGADGEPPATPVAFENPIHGPTLPVDMYRHAVTGEIKGD